MNRDAKLPLLFGMGSRRKLLYAPHGRLLDALTLEPVRTWDIVAEKVDASEYCVSLDLRNGSQVRIVEDEESVWIEQGGSREALTSGQKVNLPRFEGHPHAGLLRALHSELLVNVMPFGPVPNLWVYPRPWYRDAAMMLMCFKHTGNLHLAESWVAGLHKVWDRNNEGDPEADNLGQVLYMISLFDNPKHPLVSKVLEAIPAFRCGGHIRGRTDAAEHPVYQTKWLKFGLKSLGMDDSYEIPAVADSYSSLFWMDYRDKHVPRARFTEKQVRLYPYLGWAESHFYNEAPPSPQGVEHLPFLTWEGCGSEAEYWRLRPLVKMGVLPEECVNEYTCTPHTWHAAEMFLYYMDRQSADACKAVPHG
jgi:hypothetical protein